MNQSITSNTASTATRFLALRDVKHTTSLSATQVYRLVRAGSFPRPIHLAGRASRWIEAEVQTWAAERIAASRKEAA